MAVSGRITAELNQTKLWREQQRQISPERTKVWTEPSNVKSHKVVVPVVYYLCRNGQLEHPHFMEVPLSSSGLFLRDVIDRLNAVRGKGMASMYSWSCKRSYKNGFVWHDLSENDFIYPAHGNEYVLKGSELPLLPEIVFAAPVEERRRRNMSIDFNDLQEYSVYKAETSEISAAADASTQTDDRRRRRRPTTEIVEVEEKKSPELHREEIEMGISPPPSDSSPETLETLLKADGRLILTGGEDPKASSHNHNHNHRSGGGGKSSVLMQLITCGSISFKDCGPVQGMGLMSQYKMRLPRGGGTAGALKLEEKEYFSGSLVEETKKQDFPALKRSTSYNADHRRSKLELEDREIEGVRAKCIPRKPKTHPSTKKEGIANLSCSTSGNKTCTN